MGSPVTFTDKVILGILFMIVTWCGFASIQIYRRPPVEQVSQLIATEGMSRQEILNTLQGISDVVNEGAKVRDQLKENVEGVRNQIEEADIARDGIKADLVILKQGVMSIDKSLKELNSKLDGSE